MPTLFDLFRDWLSHPPERPHQLVDRAIEDLERTDAALDRRIRELDDAMAALRGDADGRRPEHGA